jgi:hypothetical protein
MVASWEGMSRWRESIEGAVCYAGACGWKTDALLWVEEGRYDGTTWVPLRLWNGDETDYGLNFGGKGSLVRVKLGSY